MTKEIVIPSSPADLKVIKSAVQEIVDCMIRISAERDAIKDIVTSVVEKYEGIPKKYVNRLAKVQFKQSFDKEVTEADDFSDLYTAVNEVK